MYCEEHVCGELQPAHLFSVLAFVTYINWLLMWNEQ
jgi:hypothetical protein